MRAGYHQQSVHGTALNHTHNLPKITYEVEKEFLELYNLYAQEERLQVPGLCIQTWSQAKQIYEAYDSVKPFYILFMVKEVSPRMQSFACEFMVCPAKSTGEKIKDCLVWYCDKKRNIFKLEIDLCDLKQKPTFKE